MHIIIIPLLLFPVAICHGFLHPVIYPSKPHVYVKPLLATTALDPGHKAVLNQQNFIEHTGRPNWTGSSSSWYTSSTFGV